MMRCAFVLAMLFPLVALADEAPPPPTGHDLYKLPIVAFRAYVGGVQDGQDALAVALGIRPIVCLNSHMTRNDLASLVLYALPKLPREVMDLPARDVVFRVLVENSGCPGVRWSPRQ